jgi:hypothetical protein
MTVDIPGELMSADAYFVQLRYGRDYGLCLDLGPACGKRGYLLSAILATLTQSTPAPLGGADPASGVGAG